MGIEEKVSSEVGSNVVAMEGSGAVRNWVNQYDEKGRSFPVPRTAESILESIQAMYRDRFYSIAGQVALRVRGRYVICKSASEMVAALAVAKVNLYMKRLPGGVDAGVLYHYIAQTSQKIEQVMEWPMFPMSPKIAAQVDIEPDANGKLDQLIDYFSPATKADRDKIKAMFCTPLWGGPPGSRPAFVILGERDDQGRGIGIGKTKLAEAVARLTGGTLSFSERDSRETIQRGIVNNLVGARVALFDNVKSAVMDSADVESFITQEKIAGHRMYVGSSEVENHLTYIITFNVPRLSNDLMSRSVMITLARPKKCKDKWQSELNAFIDNNRAEIMADIGAVISSEGQGRCPSGFRFREWYAEVFAKISRRGISLTKWDDIGKDIGIDRLILDEICGLVSEWNISPLNNPKINPEECVLYVSNSLMFEVTRKLGFSSPIKLWSAMKLHFPKGVTYRYSINSVLSTRFNMPAILQSMLQKQGKRSQKQAKKSQKDDFTPQNDAFYPPKISRFLVYKKEIVYIVPVEQSVEVR